MKFNHFRTEKTLEILCQICENASDNFDKRFPQAASELIGEYEGITPIEISHYYVMKKLDPLGEKKVELDLENQNFLNNLYMTIREKQKQIPSCNIFWTDLRGLVFKVIFDLRKKMIDAPLDEFKKASKIIISINSIINQSSYSNIIDIDLYKSNLIFDLHSMKDFFFDYRSLNIEYFENSDRLANTFIAALEHVYSPPSTINEKEMRIKKWKIPKFNCKEFKEKFFENGNPNTDTLLKFFMVRYDKGGIIRNCLEPIPIIGNCFQSFCSTSVKLIKKIKIDIDGLRSIGVKHLITIPHIRYINSSMMNFIWLNKRKALIRNERELFWLLKAMKETELLNKENVEAIVEFKENNNKWNQNTFEKYLREYGTEWMNSPEVINLINECLKLFNLNPLENYQPFNGW